MPPVTEPTVFVHHGQGDYDRAMKVLRALLPIWNGPGHLHVNVLVRHTDKANRARYVSKEDIE